MSYFSRAKQIGRGVVFAGAVTALSLTTMPIAAHANGPGTGAAIGLGILGGAIAGAVLPPRGRTPSRRRRHIIIRPAITRLRSFIPRSPITRRRPTDTRIITDD